MPEPQRLTRLRPDPSPVADAGSPPLRRTFVRDLVVMADIGVYRHEHGRPQRVRINLDLMVEPPADPTGDRLKEVVDYAKVVEAVRALVAARRVKLVETLAEQIAECCLADPRVRRVRVQVEKLDALPDVGSVGVEIERSGA